MGRFVWIISGVAILTGVAAAFLILRPDEVAPPATPEVTTSGNASIGANGESVIVTYSSGGFSPDSITIPAGTTITWSNESDGNLIIAASDESVPCTKQDPQVLNACTSVGNGGTYSFTFIQPGTYIYINSENSTDTGTIVVTGDAEAAGPINRDAILQ